MIAATPEFVAAEVAYRVERIVAERSAVRRRRRLRARVHLRSASVRRH